MTGVVNIYVFLVCKVKTLLDVLISDILVLGYMD